MNKIKNKLKRMNKKKLNNLCYIMNIKVTKYNKNKIIYLLLKPLHVNYKMTVNEDLLEKLKKYRELKQNQVISTNKITNIKNQCDKKYKKYIDLEHKLKRDLYLDKNVYKQERDRERKRFVQLLNFHKKNWKDCIKKTQSSTNKP